MMASTCQADRQFLFEQQIERGVEGIFAADLADLDHILADQVGVLRRLHERHENVFHAGEIDEIVPAGDPLGDVGLHARAGVLVGETSKTFFRASVVGPRRQNDAERGAAGGVRVLVERKLDIFFPFVELFHDGVEEMGILHAADFEMREMNGAARLAADAEHFVHRVEDVVGFAALVNDERQIVFGQDAGDRGDLIFRHIVAGRVDEPCGEADRVRADAFFQQILHHVDLAGRGGAVLKTHYAHADIARRRQVGEIGPQRHRVEAFQIVFGGAPFPVDRVLSLQPGHRLFP